MDSPVRLRRRVLLLDDDQRFLTALAELLEDDARIEVVATASDARSAVEAVLRDCPDVAVVDVRMPGLDGPEATRLLRAACPGLRVFGLSLFADAASREAMRAAGAERYFVKGRSEEAVLEALLAPPPPGGGWSGQ